MPTKFPQTRRIPPALLFLPILALCLRFVCFLLPGEALADYHYAAAAGSPPGSRRELHWQENTTGQSLTLPDGSDLFLLEGTLAPGHALLIPSFFGTVTPQDANPQTIFSGSLYFLLTESGGFSLRVHMPFLRTLQPRVLDQGQVQQLGRLSQALMVLGLALLIACLFPGPGRPALLMTGIYLLLSGHTPPTGEPFPGWVFTAKLLYFSLCPLSALLSFRHRYRIGGNVTDTLISFTMAYGVCLVFYHFNEFNRCLLIFGTGLQAANLAVAMYLAGQNRRAYAPAAYGALTVTLTAFLGLWLSMALGRSGSGWLMAAVLTLTAAVFLLRLPAPSKKHAASPVTRSASRSLHFADFEGRLKKLGFDSGTIARINHKCNTSSHHMQHVAEYTRAICIAMGFSASQTDQISCAALLHDIGKLEIPDAILFDPGRLTDEAFARLRSHNQLGHDILLARDTAFFRMAAEVALHHHERMDGTGYGKRKGEEIPLPARIVAVADVFDALTAPRVYKQPWDFETAFSYIIENRDIHFDGKVVDDFIKCKPAIRQIYDSFTLHN